MKNEGTIFKMKNVFPDLASQKYQWNKNEVHHEFRITQAFVELFTSSRLFKS